MRLVAFQEKASSIILRNNSEVKQVRDKSHFQVIYIVSRCGIEFFTSDLSIQMCPEIYKYISVIE